MKPWGNPASTGYSCEDFPSRYTQSRLLLIRDKKKAKHTVRRSAVDQQVVMVKVNCSIFGCSGSWRKFDIASK